jgi:hypothetical protein
MSERIFSALDRLPPCLSGVVALLGLGVMLGIFWLEAVIVRG